MGVVGSTENVGGAEKTITPNVGSISKTQTAQVLQPVLRDPTDYNVLVFIIDDVGTERYELYGEGEGNPYAKTPRLDALAAAGVLFTRAYAQPVCGPTRAALQTGRYAHRTGFGKNLGGSDQPLSTSEMLLSELVRDGRGQATYARSIFGKYHLCPAIGYEQHMTTQAYQRYGGTIGNIGADPASGSIDHFNWRHTISTFASTSTTLITAPPYDETTYSSSVIRADFVSWLSTVTKPFFSVVCFNAPHEPFTCPPESLVSSETWDALQLLGINAGDSRDPTTDPMDECQAVYLAAIEATDTEIGRVVDALSPAQLAKTLIMVTGDNGTPANVIQAPYQATHAKATPYEQGVRVPMVIAGPPAIVTAPGRTSSHIVHALDFWSTIADVLHIPNFLRAPGQTIDSVSLVPILTDPDAGPTRSDVLFHTFTPNGPSGTARTKDLRGLLREDGYKYIYLFANDIVQESLFYLPDDPFELTNLNVEGISEEDQAALDSLRARVDAILEGWS